MQHLYAIVLVVISFVIFRLESLKAAGTFLAGMFGFGLEKNVDAAGLSLGMYQFQNYAFLIVAAVVIALGIPKWIWRKITEKTWGVTLEKIVTPIVYPVLVLVVTAFLIQSSVHPFLYFRF